MHISKIMSGVNAYKVADCVPLARSDNDVILLNDMAIVCKRHARNISFNKIKMETYHCPQLLSMVSFLNDVILTHWGRVTHICVGNLTTIGSNNGLSPGRRQAIIWTNAGILLIGPLWTNFNEILIEIPTFSFKKMLLKMSSGKWRPSCLGLNVLNKISTHWYASDILFATRSHEWVQNKAKYSWKCISLKVLRTLYILGMGGYIFLGTGMVYSTCIVVILIPYYGNHFHFANTGLNKS